MLSKLDTTKPNTKEAIERLQQDVESILAPLGYEVVALEQSSASDSRGKGRILVLYIDFLNNVDSAKRISLEDCVTVNNAVDQLFESTPLLEGHYTLEVSSPGIERPLRKHKDYDKFQGRAVRIHTFRALEESEMENSTYWETHRRQKKFVGILRGRTADGEKVSLEVEGVQIRIPFSLISKAHLEFIPIEEDRQNRSKSTVEVQGELIDEGQSLEKKVH